MEIKTHSDDVLCDVKPTSLATSFFERVVAMSSSSYRQEVVFFQESSVDGVKDMNEWNEWKASLFMSESQTEKRHWRKANTNDHHDQKQDTKTQGESSHSPSFILFFLIIACSTLYCTVP